MAIVCTVLLLGNNTMIAQEVGLQLYSLRNQFKTDVPGTLKMISDWGIKKLEGGKTYGLGMDGFKALLAENDLEMVSIGASFGELRKSPEKVARRAKSFGAKYVMCSWIPHKGDDFTIKDAKKAVEVFNRAGTLLKDEGLSLVYHLHGYEFRPYKKGTLMDYLIAEAKHFDFEMDVYWVKQGGGDPLQLLKKYPDRFLLMHLKDRAHGTKSDNTGHADVETNVVLGTGDVGIRELVLEAKKQGIKFLFIEDESSRVTSQVPKSLNFLKGIK